MSQLDVPEIEPASLESLLRRALGEPAARLRDGWGCVPLEGGFGGGLGVYRLEGAVAVGSLARPWSIVLKICARGEETAVDAWVYPGREAGVYRAGMLSDLPGCLAAPRCYQVEDRPDGTIRIWLEHITDAVPGQWSPDRHAFAASCLGRFNGAFPAGRPLPADPWLKHRAVRTLLDEAGPAVASLETLAGVDGHPLVRRFFSPSVVTELRELWNDRHAFLDVLERLPQTFCHRDAHRRNMFVRKGPGDDDQLVLIDWALCGISAVGEDLAAMIMGNILWFQFEHLSLVEADALCFASYLEGMREARWDGDPRLARLGYLAAACIVYMVGYTPGAAPMLGNPDAHPIVEKMFGRSVDDVVARYAERNWPFQLALVAEARTLMREMV